jgi:hypothetical protein
MAHIMGKKKNKKARENSLGSSPMSGIGRLDENIRSRLMKKALNRP